MYLIYHSKTLLHFQSSIEKREGGGIHISIPPHPTEIYTLEKYIQKIKPAFFMQLTDKVPLKF